MSILNHSTNHPFIPYSRELITKEEGKAKGTALFESLNARRSVRSFSNQAVPRALIEHAIRCASTAPSGAHRQPWRFVAVSDSEIKREIRLAAEAEERRNYGSRMSEEWKDALAPLGTDANKGYLEVVPWIVVVFAESYGLHPDGSKQKNFYVKESVGIACGLFIVALHEMGLCTLTHTPSPMRFLSKILDRPTNEQPYILFPIGYPAKDCIVPDIQRKSLDEVSQWFE